MFEFSREKSSYGEKIRNELMQLGVQVLSMSAHRKLSIGEE